MAMRSMLKDLAGTFCKLHLLCCTVTFSIMEQRQHIQYNDQAMGWTTQGVTSNRGNRFFSSPECPHLF